MAARKVTIQDATLALERAAASLDEARASHERLKRTWMKFVGLYVRISRKQRVPG